MDDPQGRLLANDLIPRTLGRLHPVGRLDYNSEGLLLFTNDGEFTNRITSARSHIEKTYVAKVTRTLSEEQEEQVRKGLPVNGRKTAPAGLKLIKPGESPWYEIKLI